MPEPRLSIVLVTHDEREHVGELLAALDAFTRSPHELIVVDNASTDGTLELLRARVGRPWFVLVENDENLRCARATNQALALVRTEYVVYLCASHALVTGPGWDEALVRHMDAHPDVPLAGDAWNPYGFLHASRRYKAGWTPEAHGRERLRHVQGGAWIARRRVFEELGGFASDEYPHGGMDVELSYRLLSHGRELGHLALISCPPAPEVPREGALVVHPASPEVRERVRRQLASTRPDGPVVVGAARGEPSASDPASSISLRPRPRAVVFCERLDNESFCAAIVRELGARFDVRACGPGWPAERLEDVDATGARFYLELDAASGNFVRPGGLERLAVPKFAWLIDTHKKPEFHRQIARDVDLTFFAMKTWGHVFDAPCAWLPLHADGELYRPAETPRDLDVCFVGSQFWRAEPLERIARRHGLKALVTCTTGPQEKTRTAEIYARSKVVFNRHVTNDLNFRVFEALAAGRALLTDAQDNGQYELLEDERHYLLYKDEPDLERQLLRLLSDDALRGRLEGEGGRLAQVRHTTKARVEELVRGIDAWIARGQTRSAAEPRVIVAAPSRPDVVEARVESARPAEPVPVGTATVPAAAAGAGPAKRWLVLAGQDEPSADTRSYAERLARELVACGHEVTVVRSRRGALPARESRPGEPTVLEVGTSALPVPHTTENRFLLTAGPLHRQIDRIAREHGPLDLVLAEGALGQLVGPPLAERFGRPLVLAFTRCEVARRRNQLTREQLYSAELEHWACDRAKALVVPDGSTGTLLELHYKVKTPRVVGASPPAARGDDARRLLDRLGVPRPYVLLAGSQADEVSSADLAESVGRAVVVAGSRVDLVRPDRTREILSRQPLDGPALGAFAAAAELLLAVGTLDLTALDARALASACAHAVDPASVATALRDVRPRPAAGPGIEALLALANELADSVSPSRPVRERATAHALL